VMGPSGSGKTTLLNVTSGIDKIDSGVVMILGVDITKMSSSDLADFRKHNIGIVFQDFNLIDSLNVKENIILPLDLCLLEASEIETLVNQKAKTLGIEKLLDRDVYEISGGEQQRVAICRAIINTPKVLFADEPTGNLDSESTKSVMQYLRKVSFEEKCTIVMVTHDAFAASYSDKVLFFRDGQIVKELEKEADQSCFHKRLLQEQEEFSEDSFD
uniref:ABC transporter ATP-binding protein n=1 Tax=Methanobrevibacter sp. TaxID=66852 RepID=UPI00386CB44B